MAKRFGLRTQIFQVAAVMFLGGLFVSQAALGERAVKARIAPEYPEIAKRLHVEGVVKIEVTVDGEGRVLDVKTLSGNHTLSVAAEDAVRKWKFASGNGDERVTVEVNFSLER